MGKKMFHADTCGPATLGNSHPGVAQLLFASRPRFHSIRSFLFNVRRLGFCAWTSCAVENALLIIKRRFRDP